jgi:hypothetical protein
MQAKPPAPSLADLLAAAASPSPTPSLSASPLATTLPSAIPEPSKKATSPSAPTTAFLQKKWPLFSCQPFIIYLQGPTILPPIPTPSNNPQLQNPYITECLLAAKVKRNGHGRMAPFSPSLLELAATIMAQRGLLYTNRTQHQAWLAALLAEGVSLQTSKVASRTALLETLEAFALAQAEWLEAEGWPSVEAYLEAKAGTKEKVATKLTALDLEQALLDL